METHFGCSQNSANNTDLTQCSLWEETCPARAYQVLTLLLDLAPDPHVKGPHKSSALRDAGQPSVSVPVPSSCVRHQPCLSCPVTLLLRCKIKVSVHQVIQEVKASFSECGFPATRTARAKSSPHGEEDSHLKGGCLHWEVGHARTCLSVCSKLNAVTRGHRFV